MLTPERPLLPSPVLQRQPSCPQACSSHGPGEELGFCGARTKLLPLLSLQDQILPRLSAKNLLQVYFVTQTFIKGVFYGSWLSFISFPSVVASLQEVVVVENICISTWMGRDMGGVTWMW